MAYLEKLATRFVEQDGLSIEEQDKIIADSADYIRSAQQNQGNTGGAPAMQLAQSIQRWIASTSEADDEDNMGDVADARSIEKTARAHKFLSRTLTALPPGTLQAREVKLFTNFFCAMFQLQDTSISAVTEALSSLVCMVNFDPSSADEILSGIGSIDPQSFTKQVAKTRLELFNLIEELLGGRSGQALQARHKGSEHLLKFMELAGRERDPTNLLRWFRILSTTLRQSNLSKEVADAVFDSFSPFFPISIRKSTATSPEVTEQQLKDALSSCFAANGRLAHRTIPFLVEKLDGGATMTAAVKLDILRTIKACVHDYEPIDTNVLPYISQIWNSLKYEVRNGEAPEAIQETLLVFETASARLAEHSPLTPLREFLDTIWSDCAEDFYDNPAYTERLGSILVSVARVSLESFRSISPRVAGAVKRAITQSKSPAHTKSFLLVLNNLLRARRQVLPKLSTTSPLETYGDEPMKVVLDLYFKVLRDSAVQDPNKEQVEVSKEALEGLSQIVQQRRPTDDGKAYRPDIDEDAFKEICATLTYHCLNAFNAQPSSPESARGAIEGAATQALQTTIRYYPQGFGKMVSAVLDEVVKRNWATCPTERSAEALESSLNRLSFIGCAAIPEDAAPIINFATFMGAMLKLVGILSTSQASLKACACVVKALLRGVYLSIGTARALGTCVQTDGGTTTWSLTSVETTVKDMLPSFPDLVNGKFDQFDPIQFAQATSNEHAMKAGASLTPFLQVGVYIVAQLYQHATVVVEDTTGAAGLELKGLLKVNSTEAVDGKAEQALWGPAYLELVASVAATVLQELDVSAQMDLRLHDQLLACFHPPKSGAMQKRCWGYHHDEMISGLSWGIARAIRPEVVLQLHDDIYDLLMEDLTSISQANTLATPGRAGIAVLLANKYNSRASTSADPSAWLRVLTDIEDTLKTPRRMSDLSLSHFNRIIGILWGAIARGDQFLSKTLSEAISHAAARSGRARSNHVARGLHLLLLPLETLCPALPPAHTITKRLYKQWAYHHCVHPILQRAYPLQPEGDESVAYAIYTLHAANALTFAQYEADANMILRVALAAMQHGAAEYPDVEAAFGVVLHILARDPRLVRDHAASVVGACKHVYARAAVAARPQKNDVAPGPWRSLPWGELGTGQAGDDPDGRAELRERSVYLLHRLARQLDEMAARACADEVVAHLETVLGDQLRYIRQLAQAAKGEWLKLLR